MYEQAKVGIWLGIVLTTGVVLFDIEPGPIGVLSSGYIGIACCLTSLVLVYVLDNFPRIAFLGLITATIVGVLATGEYYVLTALMVLEAIANAWEKYNKIKKEL